RAARGARARAARRAAPARAPPPSPSPPRLPPGHRRQRYLRRGDPVRGDPGARRCGWTVSPRASIATSSAIRRARLRARLLRGPLEPGDLDLPHLEHRRHHALGALPVRVGEELLEAPRDDLPGDAEAVLEPAARPLLAALGERAPVVVDLLLVGAVDDERDRLAEGELRPPVQRQERLAVELEAHRHHRPLGPGARGAVAGDLSDPRAREERGVVLRRVLGLGVEPEAG